MSEAERLYMDMQMMEETAARLRAELQRAAAASEEAANAIAAIRALRDAKDPEILVQLGMGAMLRASSASVDRIPISVGAGVVIEKGPDAAINYLESRIKELAVSMDNIRANLNKVMAGLTQNRRRLEEMSAAQSAPRS